MNRIAFYFNYALRNIRRGGRWTTMAIFCIAAGVAAVVALRGLGLSIGETLQSNTVQDNKGDVRLVKTSDGGPGNQVLNIGSETLNFFTESEIAAVQNYVDTRLGGGTVSGFTVGGNISIGSNAQGGVGNLILSQFITTYLIHPDEYPATHEIRLLEPAGATLAQVFRADSNDIVVSENLADQQGLSVGDEVVVARTDQTFTVVGIVSTQEEASIRNPINGFFGFAYLDLERVREIIDPGIGINNLSIVLNIPLTEDNHQEEAEALEALTENTGNGRTRQDTAVSLLQRNEAISQVLGDFIVVMGLGALLIGGVGIMNTMLVLVRRRTIEIAAVKTFGMKGRQVAFLFLAEGLLLGLIGSVVGSIIGIALTGVVNQFGARFLTQQLIFRIHPEALLYGFTLGMVVTVIFGLAPILTAINIRPGLILRPQDNRPARLGILQTILLMLLIVLLIGVVVGRIVQPSFGLVNTFSDSVDPLTELIVPVFGEEVALLISPYLFGTLGVATTLLILGILTLLLWVLVWLVGKIPAFGNVDVRLALRNLSTQRFRTATTLLALSAGMFSLSSITFVGEGARQLLNLQLSSTFGGNVLAFPLIPTGLDERIISLAERNLRGALTDVGGVEAETTIAFYGDVELRAIDGKAVNLTMEGINIGGDTTTDDLALTVTWNNLTAWSSNNDDVYASIVTILRGRALSAEDIGKPVLIGPLNSALPLGIGVGSILTYDVNGQQVEFEVIGLSEELNALFDGGALIAGNSIVGSPPDFVLYSFEVMPDSVGLAVAQLNALRIPPTLALDVTFIDSLIGRLIEQFAAIPTVVGGLSLFAAAVIMANTVALSTLERRRQIGILKAIGLKSGRVLRIMLIESTIIGLLSAALGLGLSSLFITLFSAQTGTIIPLPTDARGTALLLVFIAVAIGWISTLLSANVAVRERVMNVLRYE